MRKRGKGGRSILEVWWVNYVGVGRGEGCKFGRGEEGKGKGRLVGETKKRTG